MTPFDKQVTFQALRQTARELRGRAQADPLAQSANLVEAAIVQLDKLEDEVERGQALKVQHDRLANQVSTLETRRAALEQEVQALESNIAMLQGRNEQWERKEKGAMFERMAENHVEK